MAEVPSQDDYYGRIWVNHVRLSRSTVVRTSHMVWGRSRIGVRVEACLDPDFTAGLDKWKTVDVKVNSPLILFTYSRLIIIYRESAIVTYVV